MIKVLQEQVYASTNYKLSIIIYANVEVEMKFQLLRRISIRKLNLHLFKQ